MDITNYPQVTISELEELVIDAALMPRPRPTLVLSPPGSGKSETGFRLTRRLSTPALPYTFVPFELGLSVPEESGGVPARDAATGSLIRLPLGPIRTACERPSVLLIDEVTRADATRQGAAMTGINERRWGDYFLHPRTVVLLAGNEPDSGGVFSLLDALLNRCCVVRLRTQREEIRSYLRGEVNDQTPDFQVQVPANYPQRFEEERRRLATRWADYSEGRSSMIAEEPPKGFAETGALWPSGRAVVHATERMASRLARGLPIDDAVGRAHATGTVGIETGILFQRLEELAGKLPSIAEINANPNAAQVPSDMESAIAALGMLPSLNSNAVWLWLGRFDEKFAEIKAAASKRCLGMRPTDPAALQAFNKLVARIHAAVQRR